MGNSWEPMRHTRRARTLRNHAEYFSRAFDQDQLVKDARRALAGTDFDTFVGTGLSGTIVAPVLAYALHKNFMIIRKDDDESTHSPSTSEGTLGKRWIFVDDFIGSGKTRERVTAIVDELSNYESFDTEYAGTYAYMPGDETEPGKFTTAEDEREARLERDAIMRAFYPGPDDGPRGLS